MKSERKLWLLGTLPVLLALLGGAATACSSGDDGSGQAGGAATSPAGAPIALSDADRSAIVSKKATCPFIGTAVAVKQLFVFGSADKPLAKVSGGEGSVAALGDTGGGDLGSRVLTLFATGNHHFMRGGDGKLSAPVPNGLFSLDFPGSQGSHPGHSGILQGDPTELDTGRFSSDDFQRLVAPIEKGGHAEQADDGSLVIRRSEIGKFIAENMQRDPNSKVFGNGVASLLGKDLKNFVEVVGPTLKEHLLNELTGSEDMTEETKLLEALTKSLGEDNLVGSSGEFGLLMAFLARSPKTAQLGGEPALSVDDVTLMFAGDGSGNGRSFPEGWETWKKTSFDWVVNTTFLLHAAGVEYLRLKGQ